jgi:YYY domain-containing protein
LTQLTARHVRVLAAAAGPLLLIVLAHWLYRPFDSWYGAGYTRLELWRGATTPLGAYLTHWGLFLLVVATWLVCELQSWLPTADRRARRWLLATACATLAILGLLLARGVVCAWVALPLAALACALACRHEVAAAKRLTLVMVAASLLLTVLVEVVVLRGDIGRMNTVFKFYLQAWALLAVATAATLGPSLRRVGDWTRRWQRVAWRTLLVVLLVAAALYPLCAGMAKARDRMSEEAPHTLDGTRFLEHAVVHDQGTAIPLAEDLAAMRWLQEHVQGSPVIVEASTPEYRWGSRMTVHSGLPGVIGWSWHQRQQRALVPAEWITDRIQAVHDFYRTEDPRSAAEFLAAHDVAYVVVGRLEQAYYPGPGLAKFAALDGVLWRAVFERGETTIYEVRGEALEGG